MPHSIGTVDETGNSQNGSVRLIEPPWAGKLSGFTLLFEALVLSLCREVPFAAVARLVGERWHPHGGDPDAIRAVSIDMSPAFIRGVAEHLPNAVVTFDKYHVIAHASHALDLTRRAEQKRDPDLIRAALGVAEGPQPPQRHAPRRPRCPARASHHQAHGPCLAIPGRPA